MWMDDRLLHVTSQRVFSSLRCLELFPQLTRRWGELLPQARHLSLSECGLAHLAKPSGWTVPGREARQAWRRQRRAEVEAEAEAEEVYSTSRLTLSAAAASLDAHSGLRCVASCCDVPGWLSSDTRLFEPSAASPRLPASFSFPALECLAVPFHLLEQQQQQRRPQSPSSPHLIGRALIDDLLRSYEYERVDEWELEQQTCGVGEWRRQRWAVDQPLTRIKYERDGVVPASPDLYVANANR